MAQRFYWLEGVAQVLSKVDVCPDCPRRRDFLGAGINMVRAFVRSTNLVGALYFLLRCVAYGIRPFKGEFIGLLRPFPNFKSFILGTRYRWSPLTGTKDPPIVPR